MGRLVSGERVREKGFGVRKAKQEVCLVCRKEGDFHEGRCSEGCLFGSSVYE